MLLPDRFWSKVERTPSCWLWHGCTLRDGYGQIEWHGKAVRVHRLSYAAVYGWPDGPLDHLCRTRNCVKPSHLEPADVRTNTLRGESIAAQHARQTHCKRGHILSAINTYRPPSGGRECITCKRQLQREWRFA
jgi:hypothetical protein